MDHCRKNRCLESLEVNVAHLNTYREKLVVLSRGSRNSKLGDSSPEDLASVTQVLGSVLPIVKPRPTVEFIPVTDELKAAKGYQKLCLERMNARFVGIHKKKAEATEKEDKKWGNWLILFLLTNNEGLSCNVVVFFVLECKCLLINNWVTCFPKTKCLISEGTCMCIMLFLLESPIYHGQIELQLKCTSIWTCTIVVGGQLQLTYQQVKKILIRIISRTKPGMHPSIHPFLSYASCLRKMPMISWTSWSTNNFSLQVNCVSHLFIDFQILYVLDKWCFEVILHLYNSIGMEDQIHWLHFDALRGRIGELTKVDSREMACRVPLLCRMQCNRIFHFLFKLELVPLANWYFCISLIVTYYYQCFSLNFYSLRFKATSYFHAKKRVA